MYFYVVSRLVVVIVELALFFGLWHFACLFGILRSSFIVSGFGDMPTINLHRTVFPATVTLGIGM